MISRPRMIQQILWPVPALRAFEATKTHSPGDRHDKLATACILAEADAAERALDRLNQLGWEAIPFNVAPGLHYQVLRGGRQFWFTAPHRVDLVGGADLGRDPEIGVNGVCCSIAIEPRCTLNLTFPEPRFGSGTRYLGRH